MAAIVFSVARALHACIFQSPFISLTFSKGNLLLFLFFFPFSPQTDCKYCHWSVTERRPCRPLHCNFSFLFLCSRVSTYLPGYSTCDLATTLLLTGSFLLTYPLGCLDLGVIGLTNHSGDGRMDGRTDSVLDSGGWSFLFVFLF